MVFLPGRFMHLLNCSTEREPCHHIILQGKTETNKQTNKQTNNQSNKTKQNKKQDKA